VGHNPAILRTAPAAQLPLLSPARPPQLAALEAKGIVYTKRWVVELLLDLAGYTANSNLVDAVAVEPAAGDGAFLGPMIERLAASCRRLKRPLSDCAHSLVAYELDEESAARSRELAINILMNAELKRSAAERLAEAWVKTGDYLFDATTLEADFVIGNPPYVRLEDIPEETASYYRDAYPTMRGRADLYIAFFEAALHQLKDNGACAFICADRWMRNQYGADLRDMVTSSYSVDVVIEMHNADAFHDEVDAYPAITVIRARKQGAAIVASAGPEVERVPPEKLSASLTAAAESKPMAVVEGLRVARVENWFKGADPWPCHSPEQLALLRKLEERFSALEASAKVGIGVATGNDNIFITKDAHLVEPSRLLKLALVRDIATGHMEWSGHCLVDPWNADGLVHLEKYPRLHAYFKKHAVALKKRHTATKNLRGWYKTIDRVTHALTAKPKLYIADIKNVLDPVLDSGETYPHHNLYFIQSDEWDLEVLGGLLMSAVGQFFVESYGVRMRGGYLRFQAQYLRRIRVPSPASISKVLAKELVKAFRARDREEATRLALETYGISASEMETALGHR
jgi:adenine-specific DNA-methyltransferase